MPTTVFEHTISACGRPQTYAVDRAATETVLPKECTSQIQSTQFTLCSQRQTCPLGIVLLHLGIEPIACYNCEISCYILCK